jgi:curved DNA-binding protein CbpA
MTQLAFQCLLLTGFMISLCIARIYPEASSTILMMQKLYQQQTAHDTSLYDILEVAPNATSDQISRAYRILSRKYHPDKVVGAEEKLRSVQYAYNILKDDATRLPYHQFGLTEISDAAVLLSGARSRKNLSPDQRKLMNLMGYPEDRTLSYEERIQYIAAHLVERLRPLVEDCISSSAWSDVIAQECASLKYLPLGDSILRCIGRAYRQVGQEILRQERFRIAGEITNVLQSCKQRTKYILEAAAVGGKLLFTEQKYQYIRKVDGGRESNRLDYRYLEDVNLDEDSLREELHEKAMRAKLESLQVEALWKVSKIYLDRAIQEACKRILDGTQFFFPTHAFSLTEDWVVGGDGWITSRGQVVSASVGRLRAASGLVLMGNTMIQCSRNYL